MTSNTQNYNDLNLSDRISRDFILNKQKENKFKSKNHE